MMIKMLEALDWLNKLDHSHLNGINQQLIAIAKNNRTDQDAVVDILKAALRQAIASPLDGMDYPETLLNCVAIELDRGLVEPARDHVRAALQCYQGERDPHGEAVALWMCGIVELRLPDVDSGYRSLTNSMETMKNLKCSFRHAPETQKWYDDILCKMNEDIVTIPHEGFTWLNMFLDTKSHISQSNRQLVDNLDINIRKKQIAQAYRRITELKESATTVPDRLESVEIFVETGFAAYRMDNLPQAIKDLEYAILKFPPRSHHSEVTRWMLGAVQWMCESERIHARETWEKSLDGFRQLSIRADHLNQQLQKDWYDKKIKYMEKALTGKISENL